MVSAKDPVVMSMDKREAIAEIKRQIGEKWKLKFENSQKVEKLQETFDEVGKRVCHGEKHRASFSALNQILCGHSRLNSHQAKLNPNKSELCDECKVPESVEHYLFDCDKYEEERKELEESVEDILSREGINCGIIDLRVLSGNLEEISRDGSFELVGALLKYIQCTKRFH